MALQPCRAVVPYSYVQYAGSGTTGPFSVSFPYLLKGHVKLYRGLDLLAGTYTSLLVDGADYTWTSATQVQLTSALVAGTTLTIRRETPTSTRLVDWSDGSNLNAADLDCADLQNYYAVQDQQDRNDVVTASQLVAATNAATALAAVNAALPYEAIGTVAGIPAGSDGRRIEVANSTGIESFSPLTGRPAGFVGSSQIRVRLTYTTAGSTWNWVDYAVADPDGRYVRQSNISSSVSSTSITTVASSLAVKTVNDTANAAGSQATTALATANTALITAQNAQANVGAVSDNAVSTIKIQDAAVTTAKIADAAITTAKIADGAVTTADIANGAVTSAKLAEPMTLMTAQASTSGTAIDFTGIPSWAKRVTVMFAGVSTSGTSPYLIRLGAGSIDSTGYVSTSGVVVISSYGAASQTTGFLLTNTVDAAGLHGGSAIFTLMGSNIWVMQSCLGATLNARTFFSSGNKTLSGTLDQLRITTVNGTDTFDAGTINVMYEG